MMIVKGTVKTILLKNESVGVITKGGQRCNKIIALVRRDFIIYKP